DAGGGDAVAELGAVEFASEGGREAQASGGERMADGDGAAVDVEFFAIKLEFAFNGDRLCGKGFVDLDAVDGIEGHSRAAQEAANRRGWANAHALGRNADSRNGRDARERLDVATSSVSAAGDERACGAVDDRGAVTAGLHAAESGADFG